MSFVPIGPAQILLGNPTSTSGTGMTNLGDTENVSIDLGLKTAYTSSAQRQGAAHADSVYYMTPEPVATAELKDASVGILNRVILSGVLTGTTMGFGDSFTKATLGAGWVTATAYLVNDIVDHLNISYICILAHTSAGTDEPGVGANTATYWTVTSDVAVPTMAIVPETQKASGASALNAIWFPRCVVSGLNGIQFGRVSEGEINQPYSIEMRSAYAATDQDGVAITSGFRMGWIGPPTNAGSLVWYLPTLA